MKRLIYSGIRVDDFGRYVYDETHNLPTDIIDLVEPQLFESSVNNNTYWFGYTFNSNCDKNDRSKFINYIKGIGDNCISEEELEKLMIRPLKSLNAAVSLYHIDAFIYPLSQRSELVTKMVSAINKYTSREMARLSFELVKRVPTDIEFDWDMYESEVMYENDNQYNQIHNYVENNLLPKIHALDYFSLAHDVKPKYRKYIKNYLQFKDSDIEKISKLQNGFNVLIVDDINTTGSTLQEILRQISILNPNCNIYIYTLIGKP